MNLKQLSLVQRLSLCFAVLLSLLTLVLFISVRQIGTLHGQVEELVHQSFPKTILANNVIDENNNIARAVRTMLIARDDPRITVEERRKIDEASANIQSHIGALDKTVHSAKGRENLQALTQALTGFDTQLRRYLSLYDAGDFLVAQRFLLDDLRAAQHETLKRVGAVIELQNGMVEAQGQAAEQHAATTRTLLLGIGLAALLLTVLLATLLIRSVKRQLGADPLELARITDSIANGQLQLSLPEARPGSVMASLTRMLESLQASAAAAATNARIKSALDNCTTNVMIADNERSIIYMNKTVVTMLQNAESDLRKALPNFAVDKLLGGNMDQFHKNPEHQKRLLANLTTTYRAQIEVGGRTFSLIANPVMSDSGERLGSVVEWNDRTLEVGVEREVADLVNAAAEGDFTQRVGEAGKSGFFLNLANGLNLLMKTADQGLRDVVRVLGALAKGDLTQRITDDYQGTFGQLKDYSNETASSLTRMLGQIRAAADTIYTAANEISAGNTDLSSRTEEQASSLEE
ncbi:hypothetical protein HP532_21910, partial [Pseudomonas sp. CrR25]|nr:hypothetical protein [Pseudomonas sp. CrR25]